MLHEPFELEERIAAIGRWTPEERAASHARRGRGAYRSVMRGLRSAIAVGLLAGATGAGCANARTYTTNEAHLGNALVSARAQMHDGALRVETRAGVHRVVGARLVTRSGERLGPDDEEILPDRWTGGATIGLGVGFGTTYEGSSTASRVGVGASRPARGTVEPGGLLTEWLDPPIDDQPWTLVAQIEPASRDAEPDLIETPILLAIVRRESPVAGEPGVMIQRLRLPDGSVRAYRVETTPDGETRRTPTVADAPR